MLFDRFLFVNGTRLVVGDDLERLEQAQVLGERRVLGPSRRHVSFRHLAAVAPIARLRLLIELIYRSSTIEELFYRTVAVAHAHVALDVKGRAASEAERLHVRKHLGLVQAGIGPSAAEATDQLFINRTP